MKRFLGLLLAVCMLIAMLPANVAFAVAEPEALLLEVENGVYSSGWQTFNPTHLDGSAGATSGTYALRLDSITAEGPHTIDVAFNTAAAGKYDVWVLSIEPLNNYYSKPKWLIDADGVTDAGFKKYESTGETPVEISQTSNYGKLSWRRFGKGVKLSAGAHTFNWLVDELRVSSSAVYISAIDCVAIVPAGWGVDTMPQVAPPVLPEAPQQTATEPTALLVEAENGAYSSAWGTFNLNNLPDVTSTVDPTSGGAAMRLTAAAVGEHTIDMDFVTEYAGEYDIWVLSNNPIDNYFSKPKWAIDAMSADDDSFDYYVSTGETVSAVSRNNSLMGNFSWRRFGKNVELSYGLHTFNWLVNEAPNMGNAVCSNGIDCIAVVPSEWEIEDMTSTAPPVLPEKPEQEPTEPSEPSEPSEPTEPTALLLEAEDGVYSSAYRTFNPTHLDGTSGATSGTFALRLDSTTAAGPHTIDVAFNTAAGEYDVWVLSIEPLNNYYSKPKWMIDADGVADAGFKNYESTGETVVEVSKTSTYGKLSWRRFGKGVNLSAGAHTFNWLVDEPTSATATTTRIYIDSIDCVAIVPSGWEVDAMPSIAPPVLPEEPHQTATKPVASLLEVENGVYSSQWGTFNVGHLEGVTSSVGATSGTFALRLNGTKAAGPHTVDVKFRNEYAGEYDIWVLSNNPAEIYTSKPMWAIDAKGTDDASYAYYASTGETVTAISYNGTLGNFSWRRFGKNVELSYGTHTFNWMVKEPRENGNDVYYNGIDCIAIVPSVWEVDAMPAGAPPTLPEAPVTEYEINEFAVYGADGKVLKTLKPEETVTAKVNLFRNEVGTTESVMIVIALYDEEGALVGVSYDYNENVGNTAVLIDAELTMPKAASLAGYSLSVMLWDNWNKLRPLCEQIIVPEV